MTIFRGVIYTSPKFYWGTGLRGLRPRFWGTPPPLDVFDTFPNQNIFSPKIFLAPNIFWPNNFLTKKNFMTKNFFWPKYFFNSKIFCLKIFFEPNLKNKLLFLTKKFWPKFFDYIFNYKNYLTKNQMSFDTIEINLVCFCF